jgi:translation initiation factor 2B subunit (eIF-2B alpha/beta/delta family)
VVLGASAVLSNGTVMARAGAASVAMASAAARVPVMVCCEAYKFHERVQLDSITHNELGDPGALAALPPWVAASQGVPTGSSSLAAMAAAAAAGGGDGAPPASAAAAAGPPPLAGWQSQPRLQLLNLKYDLMPADYVTLVSAGAGSSSTAARAAPAPAPPPPPPPPPAPSPAPGAHACPCLCTTLFPPPSSLARPSLMPAPPHPHLRCRW